MKLTKLERLAWVGCPWLFGAIFIVIGVILPSGKEPLVKILTIGFGLLFLSLYGIASPLAKLIAKDMTTGKPTGSSEPEKEDNALRRSP